MINKKGFMAIFFFTIILLLFPCPAIADYPDGYYEVGRVIDGDTFELEDGQKVRLIGIDTPEIDETHKLFQCLLGLEISPFITLRCINSQ